jgi:hypothetical protein
MPTLRRVTTRSVADGLEPKRRGSLTGEFRSRKRKSVQGLEKTEERWGEGELAWWRIGLRDLLVAHGAVVASPCPPIDELGASVVGG